MRILHISSARTLRGGEQQLEYLLVELRTLGQDQEVLCVKGSPIEAFCRGEKIPCMTYHKRISTDPIVGWEIRRICRTHRIDLVHAHDSHSHTSAYLAAVFGNKTPIVVSRRVAFQHSKSGLSLQKYHHPAVKKILCVSEESRRVLLRDYKKPELAAVVYSGIDLDRFCHMDTGMLRQELEIPPGIPLIGYIAAISPEKDFITFVNVAEELKGQGLEARFLIIGGDGGDQERVEQHIRAKGLGEFVRITGYRDDIPKIMPELSVLLFTSAMEGLGTTLLDAMACGVPVVATAAGGIPEVVLDGQTGLLAPVGDAPKLAGLVAMVLADRALRERMVRQGRDHAGRFSKEAMARETLRQYERLF